MGRLYWGPYADQIGAHEGFGLRILPDGTLTSSWTYETREFLGFLSACGCGWQGETRYPPTDDGEQEALAEWDCAHLQLLIHLAHRGWSAWAERVAARAHTVAQHVAEGRYDTAVLVLGRLEDEVQEWSRIAAELAETPDQPTLFDEQIARGDRARPGANQTGAGSPNTQLGAREGPA
jgi:hypothetical protein